jgi:hypothetical protein
MSTDPLLQIFCTLIPHLSMFSFSFSFRDSKEETLPKNIASSIKDNIFLNFFFRQIRRVKQTEEDILESIGVSGDYPYVSPCGKELNFIRPAATPMVFHSLTDQDTNLVFGGTMTQPFDPSRLAISEQTGRLYHKLISSTNAEDTTKSPKTALHDTPIAQYGLIRSSVAVSLSESIVFGPDDKMEFLSSDGSRPTGIPWLPEEAEPGSWSFPYTEDSDEG